MGKLTADNPITGVTDTLTVALADPVEMKLLHMITADPKRTPTLTLFADPDYFLFAGAPNCNAPCVALPPSTGSVFAWNHGDNSPEIAQTWAGFVGPGVRNLGQDDRIWSDHTDLRPTILTLAGLRDRYVHDGRLLVEILHPGAIPPSVRQHKTVFTRLAKLYKQINAPFGALGRDSLVVATEALKSTSPDDSTYTSLSDLIAAWTAQRDGLAAQIKALLDAATFERERLPEGEAQRLADEARDLLAVVKGARRQVAP